MENIQKLLIRAFRGGSVAIRLVIDWNTRKTIFNVETAGETTKSFLTFEEAAQEYFSIVKDLTKKEG